MADNINLAKPLKITTPGTAPIAGTVVAKVSDIADVASPWLGMEVYVEADGKTYRVTSLKDVAVGPLTKKRSIHMRRFRTQKTWRRKRTRNTLMNSMR